MTGKTVVPDAKDAFKDRRNNARQVLREHFPNMKKKTLESFAELLVLPITTWGEIVPTMTHAQNAKLVRIIKDLKSLSSDSPYWLKKELISARKILEAASQEHVLHGKQNTNEMAAKVQFVNICRQIWHGHYKKEAPILFQQESHPFSRFVGDVAARVLGKKEWSPQSAIEAYKKYK
jgi:hypothetical protein